MDIIEGGGGGGVNFKPWLACGGMRQIPSSKPQPELSKNS